MGFDMPLDELADKDSYDAWERDLARERHSGMTLSDAEKHLKEMGWLENGVVFDLGQYVSVQDDKKFATLDGLFDSRDLEALAVWMKESGPRSNVEKTHSQ